MVERDAVSKEEAVLGYGLTTAEIVYRRPDRHWLLQTYIWQDYDMFRTSGTKGFSCVLGKITGRIPFRSHRCAFQAYQTSRTARRRRRVPVALIQLEQFCELCELRRRHQLQQCNEQQVR